MGKFIKLEDRVINVDSIVRVEQPKQTQGIEWYIKTIMDMSKTSEANFNSYYNSEQEARSAYDKIIEQLLG